MPAKQQQQPPLQCDFLKDPRSMRIVDTFYRRYISEEDLSALPGYMVSVDKIIGKYYSIIEKIGEKNIPESEEDPKDERRSKQKDGSSEESSEQSDSKSEAQQEGSEEEQPEEETSSEAEEEKEARADNGDDDEPLDYPVQAFINDFRSQEIGNFLSVRLALEHSFISTAAEFNMDKLKDSILACFTEFGVKTEDLFYSEATNTIVAKLAVGELNSNTSLSIINKVQEIVGIPLTARLGSFKGKLVFRFVM